MTVDAVRRVNLYRSQADAKLGGITERNTQRAVGWVLPRPGSRAVRGEK